MLKMTASGVVLRKDRMASFTLVELLMAMAIILILAALMLFAAGGVLQKGKRSRALSEVQAMGTALEAYKADNGAYPQSEGVQLLTNTYAANDGTTVAYQTNSILLFQALSGETNYSTGGLTGVKSYMTFKPNQVGTPSGPYSYIQDPWTYSYGYSTGTTNGALTPSYPFNGTGFFDLWSTGGLLTAQVNTNTWLSNWQ